jgi:opacity protein-like surface antigen
MKLVIKSVRIAMLLAAIAAFPAEARAQQQRTTITLTPAFATVGGDTEAAVSGSIAYRFSERLSFEGDFTWIDAAAGGVRNRQFGFGGPEITGAVTAGFVTDLLQRGFGPNPGGGRMPTFNVANLTPTIIRSVGTGNIRAATSGQTMIGTLGVRFEPTVQTARFRPYVSGGLGLNHTEQEFSLDVARTMRVFDESVSHSGVALSAGGGANIRVFKSLWANVDAKYFRLSRDRNIMRLGGGVGFRF